jgi:DNA-binding transcriptional LysR family regulator
METPRAVPELRQLRAFVAVAEELNFTRAAERLHLGQQAVSKSVRGLERELGVDLLERTTHDVRLTQAGTASSRQAGRADRYRRSLRQGAERRPRGRGHRPRRALACRRSGRPRDVNRAIRDGSPRVAVSFHEVRPAEIAPRLRDRTLDLVIARTAAPSRAVQRTTCGRRPPSCSSRPAIG